MIKLPRDDLDFLKRPEEISETKKEGKIISSEQNLFL